MKKTEIAKANNSCKSANYRAVVPRYIMDTAPKDAVILDFGAGPKACHTKMMLEDGWDVTAYDFGENITETHDIDALSKTYDIVFASNVLNVQSSEEMLEETIKQMWDAVKKGGILVVNYAGSPRYISWSTKEMDEWLKKRFDNVERIRYNNYNLIWKIERLSYDS